MVVRRVLRHLFPGVEPTGPGRYAFALRTEGGPVGEARLGGGWLRLAVALGGASVPATACGEGLLGLARAHSGLPGGVKYALVGRGEALEAGAEMPVDGVDEARTRWLVAQLAEMAGGLRGAAAVVPSVHGAPRSARSPGAPRAPGRGVEQPSPVTCAGVRALCQEEGWNVLGGSAGEVRVELPTADAFRVASLSCTHGSIAARVELDLGPVIEVASRQALGLFLLRAAGALHMVRPWVAEGDPAQAPLAAGFEAVLRVAAPAAVVSAALGALTVACELCGREAEVLVRSPPLARLYLETQARAGHGVPRDTAP
jgi:hypothetical protein